MEIGTRLPSSQTNLCDNIQESYQSEDDNSTPRQLADISDTRLPEIELEADYEEDELEDADEEHFVNSNASAIIPLHKDVLVTTDGLDERAEIEPEIAAESRRSTAFQIIKANRHSAIPTHARKPKDAQREIEQIETQTSKAFIQAPMTGVGHSKKYSEDGPAVSPKKSFRFQSAPASYKDTIQHPALDALPRSKEILPSPNVSPDAGAICLCQPLPKIPRPRNAFILYRQHQHPAVVAQNPGKPNPEISKIIGVMWKEGPQETRDLWLKHAEEEKKNHLQRYPEYRYQPKRHSKKGSGQSSNSSSSGETSFCQSCGGKTNAFSGSVPNTPISPNMPRTPSDPSTKPAKDNKLPPFKLTDLKPSSKKKKRQDEEVEEQISPTRPDLMHSNFKANSEEHQASPNRPVFKKRKVNSSPRIRENSTSGEYSDLALDQEAYHEHTTHNASPSKPHPRWSPQRQLHKSTKSDARSGIAVQDKILPVSKIEMIQRTAPPLPSALSTMRGPVIAVEGDNTRAVKSLVNALKENLTGNLCSNVYVMSPDELENEDDQNRLLSNYLSLVSRWQGFMGEMKQIVHSCTDDNNNIPPGSPPPIQVMSPPPSSSFTNNPIVLMDNYILSRSNGAAQKLQMSDKLTPAEHWQWCASLWRGCVGSDMTIIVRDDGVHNGHSNVIEPLFSDDTGASVGVSVHAPSADKDWEGFVVRRLAFEIGECMRSLRGM